MEDIAPDLSYAASAPFVEHITQAVPCDAATLVEFESVSRCSSAERGVHHFFVQNETHTHKHTEFGCENCFFRRRTEAPLLGRAAEGIFHFGTLLDLKLCVSEMERSVVAAGVAKRRCAGGAEDADRSVP